MAYPAAASASSSPTPPTFSPVQSFSSSVAAAAAVTSAEAVKVLVASLADESAIVRDASLVALSEVTPRNPLIVLDCCSSVFRGGRRRFGNMTGVFLVMAGAVRVLDDKDVERSYLMKLAKIASSEIVASKELNADWQKAAANLLVAIGVLDPDLMMEEVYVHLSGPSHALPAMVQILADFSVSKALDFTTRLKDVLLRVLPLLGSVRDSQRPIFANALRSWCQAAWLFVGDSPPDSFFDSDLMSFLNSAFELLLRVWSNSRDLKVRLSSVEAIAEMASLVTSSQLKAALPRLIPIVLDLCRKDQEVAYSATSSLHKLLNASFRPESSLALLDFEELTVILGTLLPIATISKCKDVHSAFSMGLKTYNEVQYCFLVIGLSYPDNLCGFLLNKCKSKDEVSVIGALTTIKHLLPRLLEKWNDRRIELVEIVLSLVDEHMLGVQMALAELIVVMASHCYLSGHRAELAVEYLIRRCAWTNEDRNGLGSSKELAWVQRDKGLEVIVGPASPVELRLMCEKGLVLITRTIPEMEHIIWPFILKTIIPKMYTGAVATICKCICELCRNRMPHTGLLYTEFNSSNDVPSPEALFARLVVLLHDPLARGQLATHILTVLCYLGPLFPKNLSLFLQDEVPKMKAYISDPEDLKQDPLHLDIWDDMIVNFLAESLDAVNENGWIKSLGEAFAHQYELYDTGDEHSALLHRCLGMLLQKVDDDRAYVREKIEWMYRNANIKTPTNRLGLAKGIGLVAASHLDTVLENLKQILDNVSQSNFQRLLSFLSFRAKSADADDTCAALALMYGYAATYAPTTVIEARINALVGSNMLARLLHVRHPIAKQAVITAINLLGRAVINAAETGASFPLKRRDNLLDYVLTLMGRNESSDVVGSSTELLITQSLALCACTTLVSIEPKLPMEARNRIFKATLGFFGLPTEPSQIVEELINNLVVLLGAILLTSGKDGRSRAEQLLHILQRLDPYVSSPLDHLRKRGCAAVCELLKKFRHLCSGGMSGHGCYSGSVHNKDADLGAGRIKSLSCVRDTFVLPSRESLCLGERIVNYLPRCADTNAEVRSSAIQIVSLLFSISLSLPRQKTTADDADLELSYNALSSLEDMISAFRMDPSVDQHTVFQTITSSISILLLQEEFVVLLHSCRVAVCDKIKQSADCSTQAVIDFITKRGKDLREADVLRTTQCLLSAASSLTDRQSRQKVLSAICCLAEYNNYRVVFGEVLSAAGHDVISKDAAKTRAGGVMHAAFLAFSQHPFLATNFLEFILALLDGTLDLANDGEKRESTSDLASDNSIIHAAILALTAFSGGGETAKKAIEQRFSCVLSVLVLKLGSLHGLAELGQPELLRLLIAAFQSLSDSLGDVEMKEILVRAGELMEAEKWLDLIQEVACSTAVKRANEVKPICLILCKALDRNQRFEREAAAAAISELVQHSHNEPLLKQLVETMCQHVSDESPAVRSLCLRGLVQIPETELPMYISQVLRVILALLEDPDEAVELTAVKCFLKVLDSAEQDAVDSILIIASVRLRNLQVSMNAKLRSSAFAAYGVLSRYGCQNHAFLEQVHATVPRLILHLQDEEYSVRISCKDTFKQLSPLMEVEGLSSLLHKPYFTSDRRNDYEDFIQELARHLCHLSSSRVDSYLEAAIQAFDAPWAVIKANAVWFCSCMLSLLDDQHSLAPYFSQVFATLVGKMSLSPDAVVRAACSSALGILIKTANPLALSSTRVERVDSSRNVGDDDFRIKLEDRLVS